jgi:hypothetical protein
MRLALLLLLAASTTSASNVAPRRGKTVATRRSAASLLTDAMLREISGNAVGFVTMPWSPATADYDDIHFRSTIMPESFDAVLHVWSIAGQAADDRYNSLFASLQNATASWRLGTRAFTVTESEAFGVAFVDDRGVVALLACGRDECRTLDDALELARRIRDRI